MKLYDFQIRNQQKLGRIDMKLSAAFICDQLSLRFPLEVPRALSLKAVLEYPAILPKNGPLENQRVYLCDPADLDLFSPDTLPRECLFLVKGRPSRPLATEHALLPEAAELYSVCAAIQELFHRYSQWQEDMMQARLEGHSIQYMLNASLEIFHNSLALVSMDFSVLASASSRPNVVQDTLFQSFSAARVHLDNFRRSDLYSRVEGQDQVFYLPADVSGCTSLCANIRQHKKTTHCLLLLETDRPLKKSEGFLLAFLAALVEHAFTHGTVPGVSSSQALSEVLTRALNDRTADYLSVSQRLDTLGWSAEHDYCCVFLSPDPSEPSQKGSAQRSVCNYLENILKSACALVLNGDIVLFVNLTASELTMEELNDHLLPFLKDSERNAGVSRRMSGHLNLRRQYLQARIALNTGRKHYPEQYLYPFNQISFPYILEQSTRRLPGYMICDEKLWKLKEHDEKTGSDYMQTLRLYLDNHCSVVQTARELSIHRSTLLYRLEKIREIINFSLDDPEQLLYLRLSFYFIEMEEAKKNPYRQF